MTDIQSSHPPRITRTQIAGLLFILLAAAFFRFRQITSASLWMDELWTIEMCAGRGSVHDHLPQNIIETIDPNLTEMSHAPPWWHIWTHFDGYLHPPLFYLTLRLWMNLFGNNPFAVRSLSAIFSFGAIIAFFDLCRIFATPRSALIATAIMACSLAQIEAAQDARNYSLGLLLTLAAANALVRLDVLGINRARLIGLCACSFAALLTHYLAAAALIGFALYSLIRFRNRTRLLTLAALALSALLFAAIWGYWMHRQFHVLPPGTPGYLIARDDNPLRATLFRIIGLPAQYLFGQNLSQEMPASIILIIASLAYIFPLLRLRSDRQSLFWLLLMAGVIGTAAAIDFFKHSIFLEFLRYTVLASPAVYAILARTNWPPRSVFAAAVPILTIATLCFLACRHATQPVEAKEDWRQLTQSLNAAADPDDLLIFTNRDFYISPGTWYLGLSYYSQTFHHPWLILNTPANPKLLRALQSRTHIWLIGIRPELKAARLLPGWRPTLVITTSAGGAALLLPAQP